MAIVEPAAPLAQRAPRRQSFRERGLGLLSNFSPVNVEMDGLRYPSVEHAYQAAKTLNQELRLSIRNASTAARAKQLGRQATLRPDWTEVKGIVMLDLLRQKYRVERYRTVLLSTGDEELVEYNEWGDLYWGCDKRTGAGANHLGRMLMFLRRRIREELE